MGLLLFSFAFNEENKEVTYTGNMEIPVALTLLQNIAIIDGIKRAKVGENGAQEEEIIPISVPGR